MGLNFFLAVEMTPSYEGKENKVCFWKQPEARSHKVDNQIKSFWFYFKCDGIPVGKRCLGAVSSGHKQLCPFTPISYSNIIFYEYHEALRGSVYCWNFDLIRLGVVGCMSILVSLISFNQFASFCELMLTRWNLLGVIFQILY